MRTTLPDSLSGQIVRCYPVRLSGYNPDRMSAYTNTVYYLLGE